MSIKNQMEAIIFLGGDENKIKDLSKYFKISLEDTLKILSELKEDRKSSGINIEIDNELTYLVTNPIYGESINNYFEQDGKPKKLSNASMETLSIISYKQPIAKSEIEAIRGVSVDRIVYTLEEKNFVRVCGRKEGAGRANLYEVTNKFLSYMGIDKVEDLPNYFDVKEKLENKDEN